MLDPRTELAILCTVGILALLFEQPMALLSLLIVVVVPQMRAVIQPKILITMTVFLWGTAFSQAIFYDGFPKTVLFKVLGVSFFKEGFVYGAVQSMRFLAVMLAGVGFVSRCSIAKIFSAFIALKVPFYLALMGVVAARTVPQITSEMLVSRRACKARGGPIWKRNP